MKDAPRIACYDSSAIIPDQRWIGGFVYQMPPFGMMSNLVLSIGNEQPSSETHELGNVRLEKGGAY